VIAHTALYHGHSLLNGVKRIKVERDDIHAKLMRGYPEVPDWWYAAVFVLSFGMAVVAMEAVVYVLPGGDGAGGECVRFLRARELMGLGRGRFQ
jgi:hypothetical protein